MRIGTLPTWFHLKELQMPWINRRTWMGVGLKTWITAGECGGQQETAGWSHRFWVCFDACLRLCLDISTSFENTVSSIKTITCGNSFTSFLDIGRLRKDLLIAYLIQNVWSIQIDPNSSNCHVVKVTGALNYISSRSKQHSNIWATVCRCG